MRWSAVIDISLMRWLDRNTVRPSAARPRSKVRIQMMPSGSRPLTGSSKRRIPGSPRRAAAIPSRWFIPSENPPARLLATMASPTISSTSSTRWSGMVLAWARQQRWSARAAAGVDPLRLEERSHLVEGLVVAAVGRAVHGDRALAGGVEAEDETHGGGLAGAVGAEEARHQARLHLEAEVVDGDDLAVSLGQAMRFDQRIAPDAFGGCAYRYGGHPVGENGRRRTAETAIGGVRRAWDAT